MARPYGLILGEGSYKNERHGGLVGLGTVVINPPANNIYQVNNQTEGSCASDPNCAAALAASGITSSDINTLMGGEYVPSPLGLTSNWSQGSLPSNVGYWLMGGAILLLIVASRGGR